MIRLWVAEVAVSEAEVVDLEAAGSELVVDLEAAVSAVVVDLEAAVAWSAAVVVDLEAVVLAVVLAAALEYPGTIPTPTYLHVPSMKSVSSLSSAITAELIAEVSDSLISGNHLYTRYEHISTRLKKQGV